MQKVNGCIIFIMKKNKINFCTYSDSRKYTISSKHITKLANKSGLFEKAKIYTPRDLDNNFLKKYSKILKEKRGGGYWLWKHHIIEKEINLASENDIIVYCDAGSSFNYYAKKRFYEYLDILNSSEFGTFRIEGKKEHIEHHWTKKEIFDYFDFELSSEIANTVQFMGGYLIFKKNQHTKEFLNLFKNTINDDINLITDNLDNKIQSNNFIETRHDQSLMSVISKIVGTASIKNETFFKTGSHEQYDYPFLSVRHYGHGTKDRIRFYMNSKKFREPIYF